jgi:hypothetical protein
MKPVISDPFGRDLQATAELWKDKVLGKGKSKYGSKN